MNDRQVWEPWRPQVGQRVRVRLSAECEQHMALHHDSVLTQADGATGVVEWTDDPHWPGHPVKVAFETPFEARKLSGAWRLCDGGFFAAIELEPADG